MIEKQEIFALEFSLPLETLANIDSLCAIAWFDAGRDYLLTEALRTYDAYLDYIA